MAKTCSLGVEDTLTLATTCTLLTVSPISPRWLILYNSDQDVYVVTNAADGAALPSTGRRYFSAASLPATIDVSPYGAISIAGGAVGTLRFEVR